MSPKLNPKGFRHITTSETDDNEDENIWLTASCLLVATGSRQPGSSLRLMPASIQESLISQNSVKPGSPASALLRIN